MANSGPLDPALDPDRFDNAAAVPQGRLDPALDPDRFDAAPAPQTGPLDPTLDPDRFDPTLIDGHRLGEHPPTATSRPEVGAGSFAPGESTSSTLPDLLGEGSYTEERDTWTFLIGLIGVLLFLALFSVVFSVLSPN